MTTGAGKLSAECAPSTRPGPQRRSSADEASKARSVSASRARERQEGRGHIGCSASISARREIALASLPLRNASTTCYDRRDAVVSTNAWVSFAVVSQTFRQVSPTFLRVRVLLPSHIAARWPVEPPEPLPRIWSRRSASWLHVPRGVPESCPVAWWRSRHPPSRRPLPVMSWC